MKRFNGFFYVTFFGLLLLSLLPGCKSKPLPDPEPISLRPLSFSLTFKGIEADDPAHLKLFFALDAEPPLPPGGSARVASWHVEIDGQDADAAFSLESPQASDLSPDSSIPVSVNMDIEALAAKGLAPKDEYNITLITELDYSKDSAPPERIEVRSLAAFPGVQPPKFHITEIAILQAELINTRFRVALKIDNPNPFPLELSAFSYQLYGNGMFWADGAERNVLRIRERSSLEGNLLLLMNFINMNRSLLDQILRLEDVNYRFTGDVQVSTGIDYLPMFSDGFDISGYSKVLER
jgi:LEA14-like dessication related protein